MRTFSEREDSAMSANRSSGAATDVCISTDKVTS
ncbi:Uncharacterised protein [Mycobacteroides abscessus subsp. abscessus]|nr:Uncharacterised protein [Mycobacteroides abscessus subsp. abscessus]